MMARNSSKPDNEKRGEEHSSVQSPNTDVFSALNCHPDIVDYFVNANLRDFIRTRHPYDFIETYFVLKYLFGYDAHYVNFGYWKDGFGTIEPGRELARLLSSSLDLSTGDRLIDVGSGLGQAAVDICTHHDLGYVIGLNLNSRQVAFANALARSEGLCDRIRHISGDACSNLLQFSGQGFKALLAMECAGHFRDPVAFLEAAQSVLKPGGRVALSLSIAASEISLVQRCLLYAAFGFIPQSLEKWLHRLKEAGFCEVRADDITEKVLVPGLAFALDRARQRSSKIHPIVRRYTTLQLNTALRSVNRGALRYYAVSATVDRAE